VVMFVTIPIKGIARNESAPPAPVARREYHADIALQAKRRCFPVTSPRVQRTTRESIAFEMSPSRVLVASTSGAPISTKRRRFLALRSHHAVGDPFTLAICLCRTMLQLRAATASATVNGNEMRGRRMVSTGVARAKTGMPLSTCFEAIALAAEWRRFWLFSGILRVWRIGSQ